MTTTQKKGVGKLWKQKVNKKKLLRLEATKKSMERDLKITHMQDKYNQGNKSPNKNRVGLSTLPCARAACYHYQKLFINSFLFFCHDINKLRKWKVSCMNRLFYLFLALSSFENGWK